MRIIQGTICAAAIAALAAPSIGCNAIIGIEDVAQLPPDSGAVCDVSSDFKLVASNPSTSLLSRGSQGNPQLLIKLNTDAKPDSLNMFLFDGQGGHPVLNAVGTYMLSPQDRDPQACGICLVVAADFDDTTSTFSQTYFADAQGTLEITRADATGLAGQLRTLKFRHVDLVNGTATDVNDGCSVTIEDVEFDMTYSTTAAVGHLGGVALPPRQ